MALNRTNKTFIIQKYIDHPLLYHKRKFDIRCYMLLVRLVYYLLFRINQSKDIGIKMDIFALVAMNINLKTFKTLLFISQTMQFKYILKNMENTKTAIK